MHFSLLVAATKRLIEIPQLLHSLAAQTHKDFDVVFVHDETVAEDVRALLEPFADLMEIRAVPVPSCGVSKGRNAGIPLLRGELIAFPDDDCQYLPDTLANVLKEFADHPEAGGILATRTDTTASTIQKALGKATPVDKYTVCGCSETFLQFYRKFCVDTVGYFDEMLGPGTGLPYGSGEDTDYALRVLQAGFSLLRVPSVIVQHPAVNLNDANLSEKDMRYACGRMYLLRKHKFSLWFRIANMIYPLFCIPNDTIAFGMKGALRRWNMFISRVNYL